MAAAVPCPERPHGRAGPVSGPMRSGDLAARVAGPIP